MAFHIACPITCRRICFCSLGFPQDLHSSSSKDAFLDQVFKVEQFLNDPFAFRVPDRSATVQVVVPKVVVPPPPPIPLVVADGTVSGADFDEAAAAVSAQTKRVALQRKAAAAMVAAEDYARKFESGDLPDAGGEDQLHSNANVMCRICFSGENEESERAMKMLSCKSCSKKYHRSCLKTWAQHRDLFHWSSWTCPSCRICEVCRRTGDPNKFMFCKRCDGAYHCYCQQPPHKNVATGPYLCPKHTRCHSCGSAVPGNGLSVRWFLGYTCCDACGRLFQKGNYCPVCLKVYRDSEATPMVCCDVCQRWVHCQCDGISEEKYLQFQVDGNLQYKCATCRGECYQVKDLDDATQEIWRRKDYADRDLIASLRDAAGLPTQEDIFSISPYSDDEENGRLILKNEHGRSLKFSLKGLVDKSPKKNKEYGKKSLNKPNTKKKGYQPSAIGKTKPHQDVEAHSNSQTCGSKLGDEKNDDMQSLGNEESDKTSPIAVKHKFIDEGMVGGEDKKSRIILVKSNKADSLNSVEDSGKHPSKSRTVKPKKLVINLGARKINVTHSPKSDASSCKVEPSSTGHEDAKQQDASDKFIMGRHDEDGDGKGDRSGQVKGLKFEKTEGNLKFGKTRAEVPPENVRPVTGKGSREGSMAAVGVSGDRSHMHAESNEDHSCASAITQSMPKDSKPLLKFKFKKPHPENQNSCVPLLGEEEKSSIKGQRSKRKRAHSFTEKASFIEDEDAKPLQDKLMDEIMDANWVLKKLGKDAIGKIVEVHQSSDVSWHKGVVTDIVESTSMLSVTLDDGRVKTLELGKQGLRFVPQKPKKSKH